MLRTTSVQLALHLIPQLKLFDRISFIGVLKLDLFSIYFLVLRVYSEVY